MLLFANLAFAVSYSAQDLLRAHIQRLPAAAQAALAASATASAEEKACLLAAGVGAEVLAQVPGPAAAATSDAGRCSALGLTPAELERERADAARRADEAAARKAAARREAEAAALDEARCEAFTTPGMDGEDLAGDMEAWMSDQLATGRRSFVVVPVVKTFTFNGAGGGSTVPVLCAWKE